MSCPYADWIGLSRELHDFSAAGPVERWAATLDLPKLHYLPGDPVPLMAHWLFFLSAERPSELGVDGHPRRGKFLPPLHELPRRMFAGAQYEFLRPLPVGADIRCHSTILSVKEKLGESGPLVFVKLRNEIRVEGEPVAIREDQDIVYRGLSGAAAKRPATQVSPSIWHRVITPDPVLLFRYSALTFNGHRIHYDQDYVRRQEGYPDLVVHGPLIATLLLQLVERELPDASIASFSFRAVSPLFSGREMSVNASPPDGNGVVKLWAANEEGGLAMKGEAAIRKRVTSP